MKHLVRQGARRRARHLRQVRLDARRGHPLVGGALARADARGPDARLRPARLQVRAALRARHADLQGHLAAARAPRKRSCREARRSNDRGARARRRRACSRSRRRARRRRRRGCASASTSSGWWRPAAGAAAVGDRRARARLRRARRRRRVRARPRRRRRPGRRRRRARPRRRGGRSGHLLRGARQPGACSCASAACGCAPGPAAGQARWRGDTAHAGRRLHRRQRRHLPARRRPPVDDACRLRLDFDGDLGAAHAPARCLGGVGARAGSSLLMACLDLVRALLTAARARARLAARLLRRASRTCPARSTTTSAARSAATAVRRRPSASACPTCPACLQSLHADPLDCDVGTLCAIVVSRGSCAGVPRPRPRSPSAHAGHAAATAPCAQDAHDRRSSRCRTACTRLRLGGRALRFRLRLSDGRV